MAQQFTPNFKVCPACGQRLALTMTACGRCKAIQPTQQAPAAPPQVTMAYSASNSKPMAGKILGGCAALFILLMIFGSVFGNQPSDIEAFVCSQTFVRNYLKSPSTASFPIDSKVSHSENVYYVRSYVDSQNGFGAMIRSYWTCKLEYISRLNWKLRALKIDDTIVKADAEEASINISPIPAADTASEQSQSTSQPTDSGGTSQVFSPPPRDMPGSGGAAPYAPVQQYTPEEPNNRNAIPFGNRSLHGGAFGAQNGR